MRPPVEPQPAAGSGGPTESPASGAIRETGGRMRRIADQPLAPSVYVRRNMGKTLPLAGVIVLAVLLIAGIVSMMNSIPLSITTIYAYSRHMVAIGPRGDSSRIPEIRRRVETESPVPLDRILEVRAVGGTVRSIVGKWPFAVIGLKPDDVPYYLERMGVPMSVVEGRIPAAGQAEALISEPVARNLNLEIGDALLAPDNPDAFSPFPVKVVGIAQTREWLMIGDLDYQRQFHFPPVDNIVVFAKNPADTDRLGRWAEDAFRGERAQVFAFHLLEKDTREMFDILYKVLNVVIGTLVLVITVMMGMLMNIYLSQRIVEFGLLQAIGYTKKELIGRVVRETTAVLVLGWLLGCAAAYGLLSLVDAVLMHPNAFAIDTLDRAAYLYTIPVPLAILAVAVGTVWARFRRFDPVGVVERRIV